MLRKKGIVMAAVVLIALVLVLVGCEGPEPTVSPLAAPGGPMVAAQAQQAQQEGDPELTAEIIAAVLAGIMSLALEVVPGLAERWQTVSATWKRLIFLVGCLVIPLALVGLGCLGLSLGVKAPACGKDGVVMAIRLGFVAYFASQATYAVIGKVEREKFLALQGIRRG